MKKSILTMALATIMISACNQTDKKSESNTSANTGKSVAIKSPIMANYLAIGDALANDDGAKAADAGKALKESFGSLDESKLNAEQKSAYDKIKSDAIENAEHIGENADKIEHQREHFKMLSEDIYIVTKVIDPSQKFYKITCPMYKNGSYWLSSTKEVKNPFLGEKMDTCGTIDETIN
ncbi:DUF3347 domain-containing protein [Pedobacter sp. SD-b]|uniref:DUF3347 domain-containing protein n=1 Tax=Pedobacter segetis TaxID=2793069 RepID=A0ABS1BI54_9SPHI|nr:DUF3347 domain-containing protein [Pedobacter segetis]MBK0382523.1 DUF3347 domain-containing protein [Pedobacter segetis]